MPEKRDISIICAAYKLLYESAYNTLEPYEKEACDTLVNHACVATIVKEI